VDGGEVIMLIMMVKRIE